MFIIILSYIAAFALGGVVGSTIISIISNREVRDLEKKCKKQLDRYKELLDLSMKNTKYFENHCERLEAELKRYKLGGDV